MTVAEFEGHWTLHWSGMSKSLVILSDLVRFHDCYNLDTCVFEGKNAFLDPAKALTLACFVKTEISHSVWWKILLHFYLSSIFMPVFVRSESVLLSARLRSILQVLNKGLVPRVCCNQSVCTHVSLLEHCEKMWLFKVMVKQVRFKSTKQKDCVFVFYTVWSELLSCLQPNMHGVLV